MGPRERQPRGKSAVQPLGVRVLHALAAALAIGLALARAPAVSQTNGGGFTLINGNPQIDPDSVLWSSVLASTGQPKDLR